MEHCNAFRDDQEYILNLRVNARRSIVNILIIC